MRPELGRDDPDAVRLEPWGEGDLPLVERLMGDPAMTAHMGGPEGHDALLDRQAHYAYLGSSPRNRRGMFKIVVAATGEAVGSVGYWERFWRGELVYEIGWSVVPAYQGRGIASRATVQAMAVVGANRRHRYLHAFTSVDNAPSNAICRKLGFTLVEACEFEYPPGRFMQCNDWRFDLGAMDDEAGEQGDDACAKK